MTQRLLKRTIHDLRKNHSLTEIAGMYHVSHGVIYRIEKGRFPKSDEIRDRLGLPRLKTVECRHRTEPDKSQLRLKV